VIDIGLPESLAAMNAQAVALFADGDSDYVTGDVPSLLLGRPARTFEQFATGYTPAFSSAAMCGPGTMAGKLAARLGGCCSASCWLSRVGCRLGRRQAEVGAGGGRGHAVVRRGRCQ